MGKYDDRPYAVGKGKPPVETRFQPGRSGNPSGPKHKKKPVEAAIEVLMYEAVNELIPVIIAGREVKLPKKQAIVIGLVNDALQGTPTQRLKAFDALMRYGAFEKTVEDRRTTPEEERRKIAEFIAELAAEEGLELDERGNYHYPENHPGAYR